MTVAGDLRQLDACEQLFKRVNERFRRCDVLVNNAGATRAGNFVELPDEAWLDGFALKFFGAVRLTPAVLAAAQGVGRPCGQHHRRRGAHRRAGVPDRRLGQCRDAPISPRGCRGSACATASMSTPSIPARPRPSGPSNCCSSARPRRARPVEELRAATLAKSGTRRMATPEDIAALTLFLCSERARQIQGTAIAVDGGATPGLY